MSTATAPAPDNTTLFTIATQLSKLEERTRDLPEMGKTVTRTEERVAALERSMQTHDREMRSIRHGVRDQEIEQATTKGQWKGITLISGIVVGVLESTMYVVKICLTHK